MRLIYWMCFYVGLGSMSSMWCATAAAGVLHSSANGTECANASGASCPRYRRWGSKPLLRQNIPDLSAILPKKVVSDKKGNEGPKRNKYYDPNIGYEPYWAGGDWVMKWFLDLQKQNTTKTMCEEKCSPMYERYGVICGRNKNFESKTFNTYCEMLRYDCDDKYGWYVSYRGRCRPPLQHYFTMPSSTGTHFQSRATYYLNSFKERHPHI